jgi:hypothetical protein
VYVGRYLKYRRLTTVLYRLFGQLFLLIFMFSLHAIYSSSGRGGGVAGSQPISTSASMHNGAQIIFRDLHKFLTFARQIWISTRNRGCPISQFWKG